MYNSDRTQITSVNVNNGYNITSVTVASFSETGVAFDCNFTNATTDINYVPLISAEADGIGTELYGVYSKNKNSFRVDFTNISAKRPVITQINIFVFGK